MLNISNLQGGYTKGAMVLRDIALSVPANSISAVVGANGAGKTTLLRAILSQLPFIKGDVRLEGAQLAGLMTHEIVACGVRAVPEGRGTFPSLSVDENLDIGGYGLPPAELKRRKARELDRFPILRERMGQRAGMLSGGEQQMLAIGRAMMGNPKVLLLDEPSQGLAPIIVDQIFLLFGSLRAEGVSMLLVEQDVGRALEVSDQAFVLEKGSITKSGPASALLNDDFVREAFLGVAR